MSRAESRGPSRRFAPWSETGSTSTQTDTTRCGQSQERKPSTSYDSPQRSQRCCRRCVCREGSRVDAHILEGSIVLQWRVTALVSPTVCPQPRIRQKRRKCSVLPLVAASLGGGKLRTRGDECAIGIGRKWRRWQVELEKQRWCRLWRRLCLYQVDRPVKEGKNCIE